MLIHKECFRDVGLFDEQNRTVQDLEMQIRLVSYSPIYIIPKVLTLLRSHDDQVTKKSAGLLSAERDALMGTIIKKHDLGLFSDRPVRTRQDRYDTFVWLGDYALNNRMYKGAGTCYRKHYLKSHYHHYYVYSLWSALERGSRSGDTSGNNDIDHRT